MVERARDTKNGEWWPGRPKQTVARVRVYGNLVGKHVYRGYVFRFNLETGKWEHEYCWHDHYKQSVAKQCGERAARRWNRIARKQQKGADSV